MREILFRAKGNSGFASGKWIYGDYLRNFWTENGNEHGIRPIDRDTGGYCEVDPETVGQYTGLTDMEGNKIFEGDIVRSIYSKMPYVVCFGEYTYTDDYGDEQTACGWYNIENGGYTTPFGSPCNWAVIIGNIHDNQELME